MPVSKSKPASGAARPTIGDRLARARQRVFVGRTAEQALFREALQDSTTSFAVLWIMGPGGVGKTTLLARLADIALEHGRAPVMLDSRQLVDTPDSLLGVLGAALGSSDPEQTWQTLGDGTARVLFIDTAEQLGPLERWLRTELVPQLSADCLVVFASRVAPEAGWRSEGSWGELLRVIALRNLSREESRSLLLGRGIDIAAHESLVRSTYGLPLALSLVADVVQQAGDVAPAVAVHSPDVVAALLERFAHDAPDQEHRLALYAAAHMRVTDVGILRHAISATRADALLDWLSALSFAHTSPDGLYLHDLAAHALDAEFRRRDPERYAQQHRLLREPCVRQVGETTGAAQYRAAADLCWMHRFSAVMSVLVDWPGARVLYPTPLGPGDHADIVEHTRRFEGDAAAACMAHWLRVQPEAFTVVRSSSTDAKGYICSLLFDADIPQASPEDTRVSAALAHVASHGPLRPGEKVLFEYWLQYEHHVEPGDFVSQVSIRSIRAWFGPQGCAWSFYAVPCLLDVWSPLMGYLEHHPGPTVDLGPSRYVLFGHDWRALPPKQFLDLMADREISQERGAMPAPEPPPAVLVLSKDEFASAVRAALRDHARPDLLASNPLARCRLVLEADGGAPGQQLQNLLQTAAEQLTFSGKDERLYAAVKLTYLDAARTQEEAAALLGMPFSSYRRYLRAGVERISDWLWQRELDGSLLRGS